MADKEKTEGTVEPQTDWAGDTKTDAEGNPKYEIETETTSEGDSDDSDDE